MAQQRRVLVCVLSRCVEKLGSLCAEANYDQWAYGNAAMIAVPFLVGCWIGQLTADHVLHNKHTLHLKHYIGL